MTPMVRRCMFYLVLWTGVLVAHASKADTLPGATEPIFRVAVEAWLADNDADSLQVLSSIAREGNVAARLLLSRIESTDRGASEYIRGLSRKERLDLFRPKPEKGIFRPSWVRIESETGNSVAAALLDATSLSIEISAIQRLYEIGEIEATEQLVKQVAANASQAEREKLAEYLPPGAEFEPYLRAFIHERDGVTTGLTALQTITGAVRGIDPKLVELADNADTRKAISFVNTGYQAGVQIFEFGEDNDHYDVVSQWVMSAPEAAAVANLCRRTCSESEFPACANTVFGHVGGYYEVVRFDSPLEAVIPQSRFVISQRAAAMALRSIAFATTHAGKDLFPVRKSAGDSACLLDAVVALRARSG